MDILVARILWLLSPKNFRRARHLKEIGEG